jgi:hypothetical protein
MVAAIAAFVSGSPAAEAQTLPVISSLPLAGVVGNGYLHQFKATPDLPDPVFQVTAGSLPPGLSLMPAGWLTGTPSGAGSFGPTTVCGIDEPAPAACQTFTINVWRRQVSILAAPSPGGAVGTRVSETATLVGGVLPTGSVTYRLFGDPACTAEVFRSTTEMGLFGSSTSSEFTPAAAGTYWWTTNYSGDGNHEPASTPCSATNSVVITTSSTTTPPVASLGGTFHPLPPARILDTRTGAPVAGGTAITPTVTGVGGVPARGVSDVVLNVTVTQPTAPSFLTVYPSGTARPNASSLNFVAGQTVPNLVVAKVGSDGKVAVYNSAGSAHVVLDVVGWFGSASTAGGSSYHALAPARLLDTRNGAAVAAGGTIAPAVTGVGGIPTTGVTAVVVNVTVTQPTAPSFLTVYPNGTERPLAANLNFAANETVPNLVVAKVGADGKVAVYNNAGSAHVVLDVVGWFGPDDATSGGGHYNSLSPTRILDTRNGTAVPAGGSITPTVAGVGGVPSTGVSAVVLNVTVTQPTAASFLTVYPSGTARPITANLNFAANETVPNMVMAKVGADGKVAVYNAAGSAHLIFDVVGWYSA